MENLTQKNKNSENVLFGAIGAFLFALAGGILYFVLYQIGIFAAVSGLVGVICAIRGYTIFAKGESLRGIIISVIIALLVLVAAWYLALAYDVFLAYQDWYAIGEVDFTLSYFESVRVAHLFLAEIPEYLTDLGISIVLAGVGCAGYIASTVKRLKAEKAAEASEEISDTPEQ